MLVRLPLSVNCDHLENRLTKAAHSTDPETSALLADTLTGFGIINNDEGKIGESIVIIGAGELTGSY